MKTLDLYITKLCNLNCDYCYVDLKKEEVPFQSGDFMERVNLLEYEHIKFFGGEPLLKWMEIKNIVNAVRRKTDKIKFSIITNGLLLGLEKVNYISSIKNIDINISVHLKGFQQLIKILANLEQIQSKVSFSFIFEVGNMNFPLAGILYLYKNGYKNFIIHPDIYSDWNEKNLHLLQNKLVTVTQLKDKLGLNIGGYDGSYLPQINYGCHKTVYNSDGEFSPCNRFLALKKERDFSYKKIYDIFDTENNYKTDSNRWFSTCPVGWYLDNKKGGQNKLQTFKNLNEIFIDFYRQLDKDKVNFLTSNITNIRFNLTNQCNLRCNYCYLDFNNNQLSFATGKNIIDFFFAQISDTKQISFFGGEPLLCFDVLKKLVAYANEQSKVFSKSISYAIATNFLLVDREKIDFLQKNNFEIHISFNGAQEIHNNTRDSSFNSLILQLDKYLDWEQRKDIVILLGFGPDEVQSLCKSVLYIRSLGFSQIKFEMFLGEKFQWTLEKVKILTQQIRLISQFGVKLYKKNFSGVSLDIAPDGRCAPTSFDFHNYQVNYKPKQIFDKILAKYFF